MYEEIIRHLMKWQLWGMLLWTLLFLILPTAYYTYAARKAKKAKRKKNKNKKTWLQNLRETPEGQALGFVIVGVVFFCICFGTSLYRYLSLREDMIAENYATYTGEFEHDTTRSTSYVEWIDEQGETKSIRHNFHINQFQTCDQDLKDGTYVGTLVYSPSSGLLLWWDAEPIGD